MRVYYIVWDNNETYEDNQTGVISVMYVSRERADKVAEELNMRDNDKYSYYVRSAELEAR